MKSVIVLHTLHSAVFYCSEVDKVKLEFLDSLPSVMVIMRTYT